MWVDRGDFWECLAPQKSEEWKNARRGRCNGTDTGPLAGVSSFKTPEETGKIIAGIVEPVFLEKNLEYMNHGNKTEPICRAWYEKKYKCKVLERGLCVPKWDITIGTSIDGDIIGQNGLLEIKCPTKMYGAILKYMDAVSSGWKPPTNYYDHIFPTHFAQMQQGMRILNRDFCDYVIYSTSTSQVFTQRVFFDPIYWGKHYSTIKQNYQLYVSPHLSGTFPIVPS
jgi:hypothetical protein